MANEKAINKVVANQIREYNDLLQQHNTLLEVHTKRVDDYLELKETLKQYVDDNAEIESKRYDLRKQNKDLRALVVRFERENAILQESLDQCQRELMEK